MLDERVVYLKYIPSWCWISAHGCTYVFWFLHLNRLFQPNCELSTLKFLAEICATHYIVANNLYFWCHGPLAICLIAPIKRTVKFLCQRKVNLTLLTQNMCVCVCVLHVLIRSPCIKWTIRKWHTYPLSLVSLGLENLVKPHEFLSEFETT